MHDIDSLVKSKDTAKDMGTLGFEDSDVKSLLLLNPGVGVEGDQFGQYLDIERDLRHAPLIISESGCNTNTKTVSLSYLAQDRLDLAETAKLLAQRLSEPREFDIVPLKRAARYLVGKPQVALRCRRQKHVDKITVFVDSDFAGDPVSRKSTTGLVAQIGLHSLKSRSTL